MLVNYLKTLKTKGNFTIKTIADLSGIAEGTVKNIFDGTTGNPGIETISAIVLAMGGSLDAIYTEAKKDDVESNAVIAIKESYEQRIEWLKESYERQLDEKDKHYERLLLEAEKHIETIKLDKRWFRIGFVISVFIFAMLCVAELLNPNLGWFRY